MDVLVDDLKMGDNLGSKRFVYPKHTRKSQSKRNTRTRNMSFITNTTFVFMALLGLSGLPTITEARLISPHNMIVNAVGNLALGANDTTTNTTLPAVTEDPTQDPSPTPETNSTQTPTDEPRRGSELVDEALIPVYDMAKFFLGDMIQTRNLNYMKDRGVDFTDLDGIVDSFGDDWQTWANYLIGVYFYRVS